MKNLLKTHEMLTDPKILIKPRQLKRIHLLLGGLGLNDKETRGDICQQFSNQGFRSSKQLTEIEADELIRHLESNNPQVEKQRMRRALLSIGYKLGWHRDARGDGDLASRHPSVINKANVNAWCMSAKCKVGKPMEEMTREELISAVTQMKLIHKKS